MSQFEGSIYASVVDVDAAVQWYRDKLGCGRPRHTTDNSGEVVVLPFDSSDESSGVWIGTGIQGQAEPVPILFSPNIKKAHAMLTSKGVNAGPVQLDRQQNEYFEFRDLEGNLVEVCKEF